MMQYLNRSLNFLTLALVVGFGLSDLANAQNFRPPVGKSEPTGKHIGPTEAEVEAAKAGLEERRREAERQRQLAPVLATIAESRPTSPVELVGAIETLIDLDQPEEAKKYIRQLGALKLNDEAYYMLQRKVGSGVLFKMLADKRYHPEGKLLAEAALIAAQKQTRNPVRLAQLIRELNNSSPSIRALAISDLQDAGLDSILMMIASLADKARSTEHARIRAALVQFGDLAVDPLIGVLETPDLNLREQAIEVLGVLEASRATPYLIHPLLSKDAPDSLRKSAAQALNRIVREVPTERDGQIYLYKRVKELTSGDLPSQANAEGLITLWVWQPEKHAPASIAYEASDAALIVAAHLAGNLHDLWPESAKYRQIYLMALLESSKLLAGLDRSLPGGEGSPRQVVGRVGMDAVEAVLAEAMAQGRTSAAIAASEVLGDIADSSLLVTPGASQSPLVKALTHGNRRLRFAAAEAIMKIGPTHDYPGASHLPETLGYLGATAGQRRVLIGHPRTAHSQSLVGILNAMGFETETATNGRELFLKAAASPDYDIVFISDSIDRPSLNETLQTFRHDQRTAWLPISVMAREDRLRQEQLRATNDRFTEAFPRPHTRDALEFQVQKLLEIIGRSGISDEERVRHGSAALAWLSLLAEHPEKYGHYDLLRQTTPVVKSLYHGPSPERAADFLGQIGSAGAQQALVRFASENARLLRHRQAAAAAFAVAANKRGLLLNEKDIDRQYTRYNLSENLDAGTQQVLGQVLDTIERRLLAQRTGATPTE